MKRLFLLSIIALCMIGCQKNSDIQENELIEVGFNCLTPSISFGSESLVQTRTYSDEPRYLIQIMYNDMPYAYGVFNDITTQKVLMEEGKAYTMKVSYFPNGHCLPFFSPTENNLTDGFVYSMTDEIYPDGTFTDGDFIYFIPSIKYYAEGVEYIASSENATININLEAWVFGLSFKVSNLNNGVVNVTCLDSFNRFPSLVFTPDKTEYEAIYSMYDSDGFTYTPVVSISYVNDAGIETQIFSGGIPTERLKRTIVNINLKDESNESQSSFAVTLEDYDITEGETIDINQE